MTIAGLEPAYSNLVATDIQRFIQLSYMVIMVLELGLEPRT